ncbi:MAG TPA: hypothetical protein VEC58_00700, partial [Roseiarcus sp.]|nr:hypothetical protein [Roseiarcus sp.]
SPQIQPDNQLCALSFVNHNRGGRTWTQSVGRRPQTPVEMADTSLVMSAPSANPARGRLR